MNLKTFAKEFLKHKTLFIGLLIVLLLGSSILVWQHQKETHKSYIFFTVAPKEDTTLPEKNSNFYILPAPDIFFETLVNWFMKKEAFPPVIDQMTGDAPDQNVMIMRHQPSINSFYLVSASDIFAETILGWFKNPIFMDQIFTGANLQDHQSEVSSFSARKETKQNVMIFFSTPDASWNDALVSSIMNTIQKNISGYNEATNTLFTIVNVSVKTMPQYPSLILNSLIAVMGSLIVAFCGVIAWMEIKRIFKGSL